MTEPWHGHAVVFGPACSMGSKRAMQHNKTGRVILIDASPPALRSWQTELRCSMMECRPPFPINEAVGVEILVYVRHPLGHYRKNGDLKEGVPTVPGVGKDADKICRAALDVGTQAGWWRDDSRVADLHVRRLWADGEGERVEVRAWRLG